MQGIRVLAVACLVLLTAAACGGGRPRLMTVPTPPSDREQNIRLMLSYDANSDGRITRAELEAGLKRQFDVADLNHDGVIDRAEMQTENDRRFGSNGTGFSPLIDWNQDGRVDFSEFATTARSVFEDLDRNHDGVLEGTELRVPRQQMPFPMGGRRRGG